MKIIRKFKNVVVEVDGDNQKDLFEQAAQVDEVFGEETCMKCNKSNIKFTVRTAQDAKGKVFKYYELHCKDCFAKKTFGQKEDGTLFPHRKSEDGKYLPDSGWVRWNKEKGCLE